ncbi:MAG TPA: helix-turn-helix domain-containing protein [Euzebya sp.]|nr:helix-turn-helix domain-containing protein [Euzebya sp.]
MLLPVWTLVRRRDAPRVIVRALSAWRAGQGHRRIAAALGVPEGTVRGWLRRFASRAELLRVHATTWAHALDPVLPAIAARGSPCDAAWEALGVAVAAAVRRFGPGGMPCHVLAGLTGAALLSTGPLSRP